MLAAQMTLWAAALAWLAWSTARRGDADAEPPAEALAVLAAGLVLRLSVEPLPADVRVDAALLSLETMPHRLSAVNTLTWELLRAASGLLPVSLWTAKTALHATAGALTAFVVHRYALREHGDRPSAAAAAALVAFCPAAVRFSASESPCVLAALFLAMALDRLSLAARHRDAGSLLMGAVWLAALVEARPEGAGYALGALLVLAPRWRALAGLPKASLAAAAALVAALSLPMAVIRFRSALGSDLLPPVEAWRVLAAMPRLPFSDFVGPAWGLLFLGTAAMLARSDRRALAAWLAALAAGTYAVARGFQPDGGQTTNIRYYLPALVLAAVPMGRCLAALVRRLPSPLRSRPVLAAVALAAATPAQTWVLMRTRWAAQEELGFLLRELPKVPDGCRIFVRGPRRGNPGALEPGPGLSVLVGREHDWTILEPADPDEPLDRGACAYYYRGGGCALAGRSFGNGEFVGEADDCGELERRWSLSPEASGEAGGAPLVSESYRRDPFPVALFRASDPDRARHQPRLTSAKPR